MSMEEIREAAKSETNILKAQYYIIVLYAHWFLTTWTGRFLMSMALISCLGINIMLHETHPSPRLDTEQVVQMKKLEKELMKNNSNLSKSEMVDTWNHSIITWRCKNYEKKYNTHLKILNDIRILKNEAFVKNGFESWQNRLMNALPRIWILNSHLKKIAYNEQIKYEIRKDREKKNV